MVKGYFIREGDKTTCGGVVIDFDTRVIMYGVAHAREGDRVTCGKDGKTYEIRGGISYINSHGRLAAGTLDSFSSCPCRAGLIPSSTASTYEKRTRAMPHATRATASTASPSVASPLSSVE
ncbi:PAAR domain-containing protein, partial [Pseudomonas sp. MWU13-2100]|uniref:PAAR domain-containing protein n=1 Tax=Pseudomonas sp. MWU13-2100 TaxID=2935075 RepID=UPI00200FC1DA